LLPLVWVADPNVPLTQREFPHSGGGRSWLVLCRFAVGRIVSLELVITLREATPSVLSSHPPSCTGGVGRSVRCGRQAPPGRPHHVRQRCLLYSQLQVLRDATVVWAGGLHSGWNARMRVEWGSARREVGPPIHAPLLFGKLLFAIQAPSLGGERLHATTRGRRAACPALPGWSVVYLDGPGPPWSPRDATERRGKVR